MRAFRITGVCVLLCLLIAPAWAADGGWASYGGDAGGQRYVAADEIAPDNVSKLTLAWKFRTGALEGKPENVLARTAFEVTPILAAGSLIFCTPYN